MTAMAQLDFTAANTALSKTLVDLGVVHTKHHDMILAVQRVCEHVEPYIAFLPQSAVAEVIGQKSLNQKFDESDEAGGYLRNEAGEFDVDAFIDLKAKLMKRVVKSPGLSDEVIRKLVLIGNLVACVSRADNRIDEVEVALMEKYVINSFALTKAAAYQIVTILLTMDKYLVYMQCKVKFRHFYVYRLLLLLLCLGFFHQSIV